MHALPCMQPGCYLQRRRRHLPCARRPAPQAFVQTCAGLCGPDTRCLVAFERRAPEARPINSEVLSCRPLGPRVLGQVRAARPRPTRAMRRPLPFLPPCTSPGPRLPARRGEKSLQEGQASAAVAGKRPLHTQGCAAGWLRCSRVSPAPPLPHRLPAGVAARLPCRFRDRSGSSMSTSGSSA